MSSGEMGTSNPEVEGHLHLEQRSHLSPVVAKQTRSHDERNNHCYKHEADAKFHKAASASLIQNSASVVSYEATARTPASVVVARNCNAEEVTRGRNICHPLLDRKKRSYGDR